jgi:6-aminohexanoate-oligomer endohydrolase
MMEDKPKILTNDTAALTPHISFDPPSLTFDFPKLHVGVAEYAAGPTGCTVIYFPGGARCAVDIRGGAVGTIGNYGGVDAICLAGGSLYGLEAATGVAAELFAMRGYSRNWNDIAAVNGAIVWDLSRDNSIYPDKALGRAALKSARTGVFPLGARGAGRYTGCGGATRFAGALSEGTGQGGAFRQVGPTKLAVFSIVNAAGAIVDRKGQVVRGNLDPQSHTRHSYTEILERKLGETASTQPAPGNTTLTVVVTNQKVGRLDQIGKQVHASMARAIQPFHTESDGDVLYAVTTSEVENPALSDVALGALASELAWDAVLASIQRDAPRDR